MRHNNGGILTEESHRDNPRGECGADMGGGHWGRGEGDICSVLTPSSDLMGLYSGGVNGEVPHTGQYQGTLYVQ